MGTPRKRMTLSEGPLFISEYSVPLLRHVHNIVEEIVTWNSAFDTRHNVDMIFRTYCGKRFVETSNSPEW